MHSMMDFGGFSAKTDVGKSGLNKYTYLNQPFQPDSKLLLRNLPFRDLPAPKFNLVTIVFILDFMKPLIKVVGRTGGWSLRATEMGGYI